MLREKVALLSQPKRWCEANGALLKGQRKNRFGHLQPASALSSSSILVSLQHEPIQHQGALAGEMQD